MVEIAQFLSLAVQGGILPGFVAQTIFLLEYGLNTGPLGAFPDRGSKGVRIN
jgi:hypothetical protein